MYSIFEELCNSRGVTPYKVGKETEISSSTLSDWKNGKYKPKQDKLQKIADYFDVSVDYLMNGKEPAIEDMYGEKYAKLVGKIRNDEKLSNALFKYFALSDRQKAHVIETINLLSEKDS